VVAAGKLANALRKASRRDHHEFSAPVKKIKIYVETAQREDNLEIERKEGKQKLKAILEQLGWRDQLFMMLYLGGIRKTESYSRTLRLDDSLSEPEKKRAVKKAKDRIIKELQRRARNPGGSKKAPEKLNILGYSPRFLQNLAD